MAAALTTDYKVFLGQALPVYKAGGENPLHLTVEKVRACVLVALDPLPSFFDLIWSDLVAGPRKHGSLVVATWQ
jgi:hypothetical protein